VIRCHGVVEHTQSEPFHCFQEPVKIAASVTRELQEKLFCGSGECASRCGQAENSGSPAAFLKALFTTTKASKVLKSAIYANLQR
jgi:hypothetical protein